MAFLLCSTSFFLHLLFLTFAETSCCIFLRPLLFVFNWMLKRRLEGCMSSLILPDAPHLREIAFSGVMECTFEFIVPSIYDYVLRGGFAVVFCSRVRYVPLQGLPFLLTCIGVPKFLWL